MNKLDYSSLLPHKPIIRKIFTICPNIWGTDCKSRAVELIDNRWRHVKDDDMIIHIENPSINQIYISNQIWGIMSDEDLNDFAKAYMANPHKACGYEFCKNCGELQ